jgi:hypothetical protein
MEGLFALHVTKLSSGILTITVEYKSGQIFRARCYCKDSQESTFCRFITYKNIEIVKFFLGEKWPFYKLPNFKLVTENKKLSFDLKYKTVAAGIITLLRR